VGDLLVILAGELIDGQEAFVLIEGEVAGVVVGEVVTMKSWRKQSSVRV